MRILHVIDNLGLGGAERHLIQLIGFLRERGHEQKVVHLFAPGDMGRELPERGIPVTNLGGSESIISLPRLIRPLLKEAREWRPNVVSTQLPKSDFLGRLAAGRIGIKTVSIWQNPFYQRVTRNDGRPKVRMAIEALRIAESWTLRDDSRFVAVSRNVADSYCKTFGLEPRRCSVIPNSLDLKRFEGYPPRGNWSRGRLALIHVGRHTAQKGIDTLLKALKLVPSSLAVSVDFFGRGPLTENLEGLARDLGVRERVRFRGVVPDIVPQMAKAQAFVFPSLHEGLPLAYLEALASGLPVIATDIPPNREIDPEEKASRFFPAEDAPALARRIEALANDPKLAAGLSRETAPLLGRFTIESVGSRMEALYRSLLG